MAATQLVVEKQVLLTGQSLKRMEDPKFMTGSGKYVGDIRFPNMLHAAFVRSPHAHAKILRVDVSRALAHPNVRFVLTGNDIKGIRDIPSVDEEPNKKATKRPPLAIEEANYAGEAVAAVFAIDMYSAQDASELVDVEYEPLDSVTDPEAALKGGAPRVHHYHKDNLALHLVHEVGDIEKAFKAADEVVKVELLNQRVNPAALEPRGVLASNDSGTGVLTIWLSTQDPHGLRDGIAEIMNLPQARVRLITPDVGGGFGSKARAYPEDIVVAYASMKTGLPIRWIESRRENLMVTTQGRGQKQYAELAVKRDGRILGYRIKIIFDCGAYNTGATTEIPELTVKMGPGVYDIPAYRAEVLSAFTNKVPHDAYRGAGRPEAAYLIERSMNILARKLKLDPIKVRRVNFIKKEKFPFKTVGGYTYDSADYEANLSKALRVAGYDNLRQEQRRARQEGRLYGIGIVTWTEVCGFGPGFGQSAAVTVTKRGEVIITAGGHPHGQGHWTPFAQLVADELGVEYDKISFVSGDTSMLPWSSVTAGSRSAPLAGTAAMISARKIRDKMSKIAAHKLGQQGAKMVFANGKIYPAGNPTKGLSFAKVADTAYDAEKLPAGMEPTLFEYTAFAPPNYTFPFGTHIAVAEVDKETGVVKLLKYFAIDDCGKIINPMIVEGQVHGGVAQGIGQAMVEEVLFDDNGQNITSTLADYLMPSAELMPEITWDRTETSTNSNPLGVKGIGEAGTIASTPVVMNAVEDALSSYDVVVERMPLRSDYIKSLIKG